VAYKVLRGYRMEAPLNCPTEIFEIMSRCWDATPSNRPTFGDLLMTINEILQKCEPQEPQVNHYVDISEAKLYHYN
jgi:hypothetical protein